MRHGRGKPGHLMILLIREVTMSIRIINTAETHLGPKGHSLRSRRSAAVRRPFRQQARRDLRACWRTEDGAKAAVIKFAASRARCAARNAAVA